jgi:DNA-binding transcriptional ArsR family regulator
VRLQLVRACIERERPAGELVAMTGLAGASVSEHLKVLRKSGLLVLNARGRWRVFRADPAVLQAIAAELDKLAEQSGAENSCGGAG